MNIFQLQSQTTPDLQTVRQFRHALAAQLKECVANLSLAERILLCLSEALTNLVFHATPPVQQFSIRFSSDELGWYLDIFDDSSPWEPEQQFDDNLLFSFTEVEHGRGIALLHTQCDKLNYTEGNTVQPNCLTLHWAYPKVKQQQTILIVEDNNSLRLLYQTYLSKNYTVISAINGYQALEYLRTKSIDLVISDIKMPEMNGLTLRKKLNQQENNQLIPFIFLTAEDGQKIQILATDLGVDDYLIKPVIKSQLLLIIERVLKRSKQVSQQLSERIDKKICGSLKPRSPETANGWHFQLASRNTGSGGGDLLLHRHFNHATQLLLTDIMGHDDSAKFFSHAYSGYMHGLMQSMQIEQSPAQLLTQISDCALNDQLLSQITLTCCSVLLSENGKISIASAGHPPPLLISTNQIKSVPTSGVLPGLVADAHYHNTDLQMKKGERIAFYTDGLFDSADNNNDRQRLQKKISEVLLNTLNMPIAQALQNVMMVFDQITSTQPNDDALLLLIEQVA